MVPPPVPEPGVPYVPKMQHVLVEMIQHFHVVWGTIKMLPAMVANHVQNMWNPVPKHPVRVSLMLPAAMSHLLAPGQMIKEPLGSKKIVIIQNNLSNNLYLTVDPVNRFLLSFIV